VIVDAADGGPERLGGQVEVPTKSSASAFGSPCQTHGLERVAGFGHQLERRRRRRSSKVASAVWWLPASGWPGIAK
jgi:hypothetical protein